MKFPATLVYLGVCLFAGAGAFAQDHGEDAMFGAPAPTKNSPAATKAEPPKKDELPPELTPSEEGHDAFASGKAIDNPLQIGGRYYQRFLMSVQDNTPPRDTPISFPLQFDGFLDARPSDRIRGYINARLAYDPTRDGNSQTTGGTTSFSSTSTGFDGLSGIANPRVSMDQAWLKFDMARVVFVTAGKQHVKWGASRYWNPTDYLHSTIRDPLLPIDLRLGQTMIKFDVPWESQETTFTAAILFDNPTPASVLGQVGGALRAETVLGGVEMGIDAVVRKDRAPAYGVDVSTGLGPFDVYAEAAILSRSSRPQYALTAPITAGSEILTLISSTQRSSPLVQVSGGFSYTFGWLDNRQATAGFEYFFNQEGNPNSSVYPILAFTGEFLPLYSGRHYAAIYVTAEGPDSGKHTNYTLSTLANLSDNSYLTRIDFAWRVLEYLTFDAWVGVHYGKWGGEFRFGLETPALTLAGNAVPAVHIPVTWVDFGLALRVAF